MTTITLQRKSSSFVTRSASTTRVGNNPSALGVNGHATHTRFSYLTFAIPTVVMQPGTVISSARLEFDTYEAWTGSHNIVVARVTSAWSASTVTWAKLPSVTDLITQPVTALPKGRVVSVNVLSHLTSMQAGARNLGFRVSTSATTQKRIANKTTVARLVIEYYVAPPQPRAVSPADEQVVPEATPTFRLTFADPNVTRQEAIRVQVNSSNDFTQGIDYDSGTILTDDSELDTRNVAGFLTLTEGQPYYWRAQIRGTGGKWSPWSTVVGFSYRQLGTVTIGLPAEAPNNIAEDPSPVVSWVYTGTQTKYRVQAGIVAVGSSDPEDFYTFRTLLHDSGVLRGIDDTYTLPALFGDDDVTYGVIVHSYDGYNRVPGYSRGEYSRDSRTWVFQRSSVVAPPTNLVHEDLSPMPFSKLTWERDTAPDQFQIIRDGKSVAVVNADDAFVEATHYEYVDDTAAPRRPHTWSVRAILNKKTSLGNPQVSATVESAGVWLSDPAAGTFLTIITRDNQSIAMSEVGATFTPLRAKFGVRITTALNGYSGTITGELVKTPLTGSAKGTTLADRFLAVRNTPGRRMTLSMADLAIHVVPFNMTIAPTPHMGSDGDYRYLVSFEFIEVA